MKFFKSLIGYLKLKKQKNIDIVIYSESKAYYTNFKTIIDELIINKVKILYVTSSYDDKIFQLKSDYLTPIYIENTILLILFFNYLKAKILLTTMPDIDTFYLKRSIHVKKMMYVHHSLASMNMIYLPKAFESYDSIFCVGPYHINEVRELEKEYGTKLKDVIKAGYPALDDFMNRYNDYIKDNTIKNENIVITIAPSWQQDNILDMCIDDLLNNLLNNNNFRIVLRPHPMTLKYEKYKLEKILKNYNKFPNFSLDINPGNFYSYLETDVMITDWSFTVYKFVFTTFKPVIFINTPIKVRNKNYKSYKNVPVDIKWRSVIGMELSIDDIHSIADSILKVYNDTSRKDVIKQYRDKNIYNIGSSGKVCAEYIIKTLHNL